MKKKQFDLLIKPVLVLVAALAIIGGALITVSMLTEVYRDDSHTGTVQSTNGSLVAFSDGTVYRTPFDDIGKYCQPGDHVRVHVEYGSMSVRCNGELAGGNFLDGIT